MDENGPKHSTSEMFLITLRRCRSAAHVREKEELLAPRNGKDRGAIKLFSTNMHFSLDIRSQQPYI